MVFDDPHCPWGVHLSPWSPAWPQPAWDRVTDTGGAVAGILRFQAFAPWCEHLQQESPVLARRILETLCHHLHPLPAMTWGSWRLTFDKPLVMGVVNVTPDSFSDGGRYLDPDAAVAHGLALAAAGVDLLDVGGESTRPGAEPVSLHQELDRVLPVVTGLARHTRLPISVDTSKARVAAACLAAGAAMINDVTAMADPAMADVVRQAQCPLVLMHMQGQPRTMQQQPCYDQVVPEVYAFLATRLEQAQQAGVSWLMVDPGIGFGKETGHNMALLHHLRTFYGLGVPVVLGVSRKRLLGHLTGLATPSQRDVAGHVLAGLAGGHVVRVHDGPGGMQMARVAAAWAGTDM